MSMYLTIADVTLPKGRARMRWDALEADEKATWLRSISASLDTYTQQLGGLARGTRTYTERIVSHARSIALPNLPVNALISITVNDVVQSVSSFVLDGRRLSRLSTCDALSSGSTVWESRYDVDAGLFGDNTYERYSFRPNDVVTVVYDAGLTTMPDELRFALLKLLTVTMNRMADNPSDAGLVQEDMAILNYALGVGGQLDDVYKTLEAYRTPVAVGAS